MKNNEELLQFADNLGRYILEKHIRPMLARTVSFYRAKVTSAAANGKMGIKTPYSDEIFLPYVSSAARLTVGTQCVVLEFGSSSNAFILGDAKLTNL